jgi:hypothetical protein
MSDTFVDHLKNIPAPSIIEDLNEMGYYYNVLGHIPGSGVTLNSSTEMFPPDEQTSKARKYSKGAPRHISGWKIDDDWWLVQETPLNNRRSSIRGKLTIVEHGLYSIRDSLISKIPPEALVHNEPILYDDIKLKKRLYDLWIRNMTKEFNTEHAPKKFSDEYKTWADDMKKKKEIYTKRKFVNSVMNKYFIQPKSLKDHMLYLKLIEKKIVAAESMGIINNDPLKGYYYSFQKIVSGEIIRRQEFWDKPDVFHMNSWNIIFDKYKEPLLPKSSEKKIDHEQHAGILNLDRELRKCIDTTTDIYSDVIKLKIWYDNQLNQEKVIIKANEPNFFPSATDVKKIKQMLGVVNNNTYREVNSNMTDKIKEIYIRELTEKDRLVRSVDQTIKSIPAVKFTKLIVEKTVIMINMIDYYTQVLLHFKDYFIQKHKHTDQHETVFFIGNEIHISEKEYDYLFTYIDELITDVLPTIKNKIKISGKKEHTKSIEKIKKWKGGQHNKQVEDAVEKIITDIDLLKMFEPSGVKIHNNRGNNNRPRRSSTPSRTTGDNDMVSQYERERMANVRVNQEVLDGITEDTNNRRLDLQRRDHTERRVLHTESDAKYKFIIKMTGTLVLPLIIRHLTMNIIFQRFNPIIKKGNSNEIIGIYPSKKMFEKIIINLCMKTSAMTSHICTKYFHPDNFIDAATFKESIQHASMEDIFQSRIRYLSFSYMNSTGVGGSDPQSKTTMNKLYLDFVTSMEKASDSHSILVIDKYEEACMELLDTNVFSELKLKTSEAFKKINTPRNELLGITYDNGKTIQDALLDYALDSQIYNTLLVMTEETVRMWAYKVYWDWALVSQSVIINTVLPVMSNKYKAVSSVSGAIISSQVERIYTYSKSFVQQPHKMSEKVDNNINSLADNFTNFTLYGLETGVLYFWLNLLNGYTRFNVETEDELVKGKTYMYNNSIVRYFEEIHNITRNMNKNPTHTELIQISYKDKGNGIHIDTKNPLLYVDEERFNTTPINIGIVGSNRLRHCLYPQGSVVKFRKNGIWETGIVVDDLGGIWRDQKPLDDEKILLEEDINADEIDNNNKLKRLRILFTRSVEYAKTKINGNERNILYLKRKFHRTDVDEDIYDVGTSIINVSEEYMGERYRNMINLQILSGILSVVNNNINRNNFSTMINLLLQILAGNILDNISFIALLIPVVVIGTQIIGNEYIENDLIMLQTSMVGTYLFQQMFNSVKSVKDGIYNKMGECLCIIVALELNIKEEESRAGNYVVESAVFWVPTTATMMTIDKTSGGIIVYGLPAGNQQRSLQFNFNARPTIKLNGETSNIELTLSSAGAGNQEFTFKRPLFSNTDWSIKNQLNIQRTTDLIYHPWYYCIFKNRVE